MKHQESTLEKTEVPPFDKDRQALILGQLARIQSSRAFGNSARAKEFLSYVVKHALESQTEFLKERAIGVELFHRDPAYVASDDPIVRVQASEVRRRLGEYYAEEERAPEVRIELPVGSYIPRFHSNTAHLAETQTAASPAIEQERPRSKHLSWKIAAGTALVAILAIPLISTMRSHVQQKSPFNEFWAPAFATGQPILICISSPVLYIPGSDLYTESSHAHPGLYDSFSQRSVTALQLDPNTRLKWKDIEPRADVFVNKAHVYNVALLSALFERLHKTSQIKVGSDFSYNDLQNSPAVLLGAFDNPWSVRMAAELPFYFDDRDYTIVERGSQHRVWSTPGGKLGTRDFAIVARLLNSKTGQFQVIFGGISSPATEAAGKLVTREDLLDAALQPAPMGWQSKNLEFVLETDVIAGADSSIRIVAMKTW